MLKEGLIKTTTLTALKGLLTLLGNMKEIITNIARGRTQTQLSCVTRKRGRAHPSFDMTMTKTLKMVGDLNYPLERGWEPLIKVGRP